MNGIQFLSLTLCLLSINFSILSVVQELRKLNKHIAESEDKKTK